MPTHRRYPDRTLSGAERAALSRARQAEQRAAVLAERDRYAGALREIAAGGDAAADIARRALDWAKGERRLDEKAAAFAGPTTSPPSGHVVPTALDGHVTPEDEDDPWGLATVRRVSATRQRTRWPDTDDEGWPT